MSIQFTGYEVHPVKEFGNAAEICAPQDADFWSVYGVLPSEPQVLICVGDYATKDSAEVVVGLLKTSADGPTP